MPHSWALWFHLNIVWCVSGIVGYGAKHLGKFLVFSENFHHRRKKSTSPVPSWLYHVQRPSQGLMFEKRKSMMSTIGQKYIWFLASCPSLISVDTDVHIELQTFIFQSAVHFKCSLLDACQAKCLSTINGTHPERPAWVKALSALALDPTQNFRNKMLHLQ